MNEADGSQYWKTGLRRRLTSEETAHWQDHLSAQPDALAGFEEEINLNRLLAELPEAPLPSNFTSRVMEEIQTANKASAVTARWWRRCWDNYIALGWTRKLAFASV